MAQGEYKVGQAIEVTYQATKATSGLVDVTMEIYDELGAKDIINFPDVIMTEIGSTGRYKGLFTPDVEGKWRVMIDSASKAGKIIRDYGVVGHNIDAVGDAIATVDSTMAKEATVSKEATAAKEATVSKEATAAKDATVAKEATVAKDSTVAKAGADGDTLKDLSDQIDLVGSADSAPMIG